MTRSLVLALAVSLVVVTGCTGSKSKDGGQACVPGATGQRAYDATAYHLAAAYDWSGQTLSATEDVTVALCPGAGPRIVLDAASNLAISRVRVGAAVLPTTRGASTLEVDLSSLRQGTDPITFTIDYQATASDALIPTTSTPTDPVQSRVVFTDSEPDRARQWLVCKDDPADRARFSVDLTVPDGEDVVANGERVGDVAVSGGHRVSYALEVPIPTYLMAFAAGELDHAERVLTRSGGAPLPIGVWWRRGLALDPDDNLDAIAESMPVLEARLGPYPFARYAVVLLPYGGGMENATITFDAERTGQGGIFYGLQAHELAHHWFGDWVTMQRYEDVWVKEGMATLLAAEAQRPFRDREGKGRLFARDFQFDPRDAIVDPTLTGLARYTSGPYERAATLITQVRAAVGEEAFWRHCREFLAAHAAGSATGEDFLRAFAPELSDATIHHLIALLPEKGVSWITGTFTGSPVTNAYETSDPLGWLVVLPTATAVAADGTAVEHPLAVGTVTFQAPVGGYVAFDEAEVHWQDAGGAPWYPDDPGGPAAAALLARSAALQEVIACDWAAAQPPERLPGLVADLDSDWARVQALQCACDRTRDVVPELLAEPVERWPLSGRLYYGSRFLHCGPAATAAFEPELVERASRLAVGDLRRLEYLISFAYGPDGTAAIQRIAALAPSLRLRTYATQRLALSAPVVQNALASGVEGRENVRAMEAKAARAPR